MTEGGQLVGVRKFRVIAKDAPLSGLLLVPLTGTGTGSARSPGAGSAGGGAGSARSPGAGSGSGTTGQAGGSAR
jgi:hypothetical protein